MCLFGFALFEAGGVLDFIAVLGLYRSAGLRSAIVVFVILPGSVRGVCFFFAYLVPLGWCIVCSTAVLGALCLCSSDHSLTLDLTVF